MNRFKTTKSAILGYLACWIIRQLPDFYPTYLVQGLVEFENTGTCNYYFETSYSELRDEIRETISKCPTILGWYELNFDTLAQNVARAAELEAKCNE